MEGIVHCRFKNDKMCWKILPIEILGALTRLVVFLTFKKAQQNLSERRQHETIYALRHLREKIYFTRPEVERNGQGEVERAGRKSGGSRNGCQDMRSGIFGRTRYSSYLFAKAGYSKMRFCRKSENFRDLRFQRVKV